MIPLSLSELDARSEDVEAAVDATGGIDRWCSGPDWVLPVNQAFAPDADPIIIATTDGFALCALYQSANGNRVVAGLEALWGFSFPIVGANPVGISRQLATHLEHRDDWDFLVLPGAPGPNHPLTIAVATELARLGPVGLQEGIIRQVADLREGFEPWLSRRSPKFRRNLRRSVRAATVGRSCVTIQSVSDDPNLFDRILAIERRSWKGAEDSGITSPEMSTMYATMIDRLQSRSRLHAHIANVEGDDGAIDVGYILGGIRNRRYRGLQISYVADVADLANASIGNLLQHHQLVLLCDADLADHYDMGMDFGYKRRWADRPEPSATIVLTRAD